MLKKYWNSILFGLFLLFWWLLIFWFIDFWLDWILKKILAFLYVIIWFYVLIMGWDSLVNWWIWIAKIYRIPSIVIWLTIISFWTSAPEFFVNVLASIKWESWIVISNVIWSNLSNILLILWITSIIFPLVVKKNILKREIPISILATLIIILLLNIWSDLSRIDWVILFILFGGFMYYVAKLSGDTESDEEDKIKLSFWKSIFMIIVWILWLYIGGELIVNNSVFIAESFGLSDVLIWATIVALWTSLPELTASVIAAKNKQTDMALWNIIWSNIFNILWILWASSVISNIEFNTVLQFDVIYLLIASIIVFIFAHTSKKISKIEWIFLLLIYIFYILYIVMRW